MDLSYRFWVKEKVSIIPLDGTEGIILFVVFDVENQYKVRYFCGGSAIECMFYEWELELPKGERNGIFEENRNL